MYTTITSPEEFNALIARERPTLVVFGSEDCPACRATKDELLAFSARWPKLLSAFVDVDQQEVIAGQHVGKKIPLLVVFRGGAKLRKRTGQHSLEEMEEFVDKALA